MVKCIWSRKSIKIYIKSIESGFCKIQQSSKIYLITLPEAARADYDAGVAAQDFERAHVTVGEAVGLLQDAPSAAELIERITKQAEGLIG